MRVLLCSVCLALLLSPGTAQGQGVGLLGGVTLPKINVAQDEFLNLFFNQRVEPTVGVFASFPVRERWTVDGELNFTVKGAHLDYGPLQETLRLSYAELTLMPRFIPEPDSPLHWLRIFGGAYGGVLLKGTAEAREFTRRTDLRDAIQTFDTGFVGGFGVHVGGVDIDARYSGSLMDIGQDKSLGVGFPGPDVPVSEAVKYRNRTFSVLVRREFGRLR